MMNKLTFLLLKITFGALSLLPFRVLYFLSDCFYLLIRHVIRYRLKVVRRNIRNSFPDKNPKELRKIEHGFYHFFCDYFVETIKLLTISRKSMLRHIEFRGVEDLESCFDRGQNCSAILGHYCNWEWLSATGLAFRRYPDAVTGLIYHPLFNKAFDRLFVDIRQSMGGVCVPKKDILRHLVTYRREDRHWLFGYISDQAPKWDNIHLWLPFLNQNTPVFTGGERIMRKMNDAVFYVDMERPRRGHYICTFHLITNEPNALTENTITRRFFEMLEATIRRQPELYLWSHNRWKRTYEEYLKRMEKRKLKAAEGQPDVKEEKN